MRPDARRYRGDKSGAGACDPPARGSEDDSSTRAMAAPDIRAGAGRKGWHSRAGVDSAAVTYPRGLPAGAGADAPAASGSPAFRRTKAGMTRRPAMRGGAFADPGLWLAPLTILAGGTAAGGQDVTAFHQKRQRGSPVTENTGRAHQMAVFTRDLNGLAVTGGRRGGSDSGCGEVSLRVTRCRRAGACCFFRRRRGPDGQMTRRAGGPLPTDTGPDRGGAPVGNHRPSACARGRTTADRGAPAR